MIFTEDEAADRAFLQGRARNPVHRFGRRLADLQAAAGRAGRPFGRQRLPPALLHLRRRRRLRREDGGKGRRHRSDLGARTGAAAPASPLPGGGKLGIYEAHPRPALTSAFVLSSPAKAGAQSRGGATGPRLSPGNGASMRACGKRPLLRDEEEEGQVAARARSGSRCVPTAARAGRSRPHNWNSDIRRRGRRGGRC